MAATENNSFIDPPPQSHPGDYSFASSIEYGSPQKFRWTFNYKIPLDLSLIQETHFLDNNAISPQIETLASNLTNTSYSWSGEPSPSFNLSLSNLFWLAMYNASHDNSNDGPLFMSEYFNVTSNTTSSSTTTTSSSSSTILSSLSSSTLPAQVTTTPASTVPSASPTPSGKPESASDKVALGAGLGVGLGGAALIIGLSVAFFLGRKRQGRSRKRMTPEVYQLAENDNFSR